MSIDRACTPPPAWGGGRGVKISKKSLLGGSEIFILVGGGGYCWGGEGRMGARN